MIIIKCDGCGAHINDDNVTVECLITKRVHPVLIDNPVRREMQQQIKQERRHYCGECWEKAEKAITAID